MTAPRAARITAALAVLALPVAAVSALLAAPASADDLGSLTFTPASGSVQLAPVVTTSGPCTPGTQSLNAQITGGNVPANGNNGDPVYGIGNNAADVAMDPISASFELTLSDIASNNNPVFSFAPPAGQPPLTYTVTLNCSSDIFGAVITDTYDGQFTVSSDGTYTGVTPDPDPTPTPTVTTTEPTPTPTVTTTDPTPTPTVTTTTPTPTPTVTTTTPTPTPTVTEPSTGTSDNVTVIIGGNESDDREPTLERGDVVTLEASGFEPGEEVDVLLIPEPTFDDDGTVTEITVNPLTTLVADDEGTVSYPFTVPADAEAGVYALGFLGADSENAAVFVFDVVVPAATPSPTTSVTPSGTSTATTAVIPSTRPTTTGPSALARTGASVGAGLALATVLIGAGAGAVVATRPRGARQL